MFLGGFSATYQGGHPDFGKSGINGGIRLTDGGLEFAKNTMWGTKKLFLISYDKIKSLTTDIEKEWSGTRLAVGWLFLGPLGALFFGKRKTEQLGLVVEGTDSKNNLVEILIVFAPVEGSAKLKARLTEKIAKAKGVKI